MSSFVRLRPQDKKRGAVKATYTHGPSSTVFHHGRWYHVSDAMGAHLRTVRQRDMDPESPRAFDVTDEAGMRKIIAAEKAKLAELRNDRDQERVTDLTSGDLRGRRPKPEPVEEEEPEEPEDEPEPGPEVEDAAAKDPDPFEEIEAPPPAPVGRAKPRGSRKKK